jgi:hypothetical protein
MANTPDFLEQKLLERFGPLISGADLYACLGYKGYAAFYRAKSSGELGVRVFRLPGRKGWFAFSSEVADWLTKHSEAER